MSGVELRCLLFFVLSPISAIRDHLIDVASYEGYQVVRLYPRTRVDLQTLLNQLDSSEVEILTEVRLNKSVEILIPPDSKEDFLGFVEASSMRLETMIPDVQKKENASRIYCNIDEWNCILNPVEAFTRNIKSKFKFVQEEVIGQSFENRNLTVVTICKGGCGRKPSIWINAGSEGRDWLSPTAASYVIFKLTLRKNAQLLEFFDWYILPVSNPDGFAYSWTKARLWSKTKSYEDFHCKGVDLNRNYGFQWNSSPLEKCLNKYPGKTPFSEPESKSVRDFVLRHKSNLVVFSVLQNSAGKILFPWSFTTESTEDEDELTNVYKAGQLGIFNYSQDNYETGCSSCCLYVSHGNPIDWAYAEAGIHLSFNLRLNGDRNLRFLAGNEQVLKASTETWLFYKSVAIEILRSKN